MVPSGSSSGVPRTGGLLWKLFLRLHRTEPQPPSLDPESQQPYSLASHLDSQCHPQTNRSGRCSHLGDPPADSAQCLIWVWSSLGAEASGGEGATRCWETWGVVCVLTYAHTRSLTHFHSHTITHPRSHIPELWCGDLQEAWLTADGATINLFLRDKAALVVSTSMVLPLPRSVCPPTQHICISPHITALLCRRTHSLWRRGFWYCPQPPSMASLSSPGHILGPHSWELRAESAGCKTDPGKLEGCIWRLK